MHILSIALDKTMRDPESVALTRQAEYYRGHKATIMVLETGPAVSYEKGDLHVVMPGGASKLAVLWGTLRFLSETKESYDLVVAQDILFLGLLGYYVAHCHGARLITQVHGDYLDNPRWLHERKLNYLRNVIGKFILKKSTGIRCVSGKIVKDLHERLGVPLEKMLSAPIGTDLSIFTPDGDRADIGYSFIFFVGRLLPEKSPMLFVEVASTLMREFPDLHAVLAGDGSMRGELEEAFRLHGFADRVHFLGHVSGAELAKYYRAAICNVHTAAWEGWGMPMVESMAAGCPVVTTDTGCAGEAVLDNVNGIVVPIDDVKGLTDGTRRFIVDESFWLKCKENAVAEAKNWSFEALADKIRTWYETIGIVVK